LKVLLLGAGGMLARDLMAQAPDGVDLVPPTRAETDVTAEAAVAAALREVRPQVIINCAAYTNVDEAEAERQEAFLVNGVAPGIIGRAASAPPHRSPLTALVVHFSTDYVFDGRSHRPYREDDPTDPIGAYGASKLAGEQALAASGVTHLIVRTQWLFGLGGRSFPRTMWERATAGKATRVVNDQLGRPTYTVDLARAVWHVIGKRSGILHIANLGQATRYDVARRVFHAAGVPGLLSPCTTAEYPTPARRPAYSVLDTAKYESLAGTALPRWEDALDRFLQELTAEARG